MARTVFRRCHVNEPSGNITGVSWFGSDLVAKKLELLLQLVPDAGVVALLLNPNNAEVALQPSEFEEAVKKLGRQFHILHAGTDVEIDKRIPGARPTTGRRARRRFRSILVQSTTADHRAGR